MICREQNLKLRRTRMYRDLCSHAHSAALRIYRAKKNMYQGGDQCQSLFCPFMITQPSSGNAYRGLLYLQNHKLPFTLLCTGRQWRHTNPMPVLFPLRCHPCLHTRSARGQIAAHVYRLTVPDALMTLLKKAVTAALPSSLDKLCPLTICHLSEWLCSLPAQFQGTRDEAHNHACLSYKVGCGHRCLCLCAKTSVHMRL